MRERRRGVAGSNVRQARCKGEGGRNGGEGGEGRRNGTLPGSTGGPEVVRSAFSSLMVVEERAGRRNKKRRIIRKDEGARVRGDVEEGEGGSGSRTSGFERSLGLASAPHLKLIITADST